MTYTCSCGKTHTEPIAKIAHNYKTTSVMPTCEEMGYTVHTCAACGDSYKDNYVKQLEHKWDKGEIITAPTLTSTGVMEQHCTSCGGNNVTVLPALKGCAVRFAKDNITLSYKNSMTLTPEIISSEGMNYSVKYTSDSSNIKVDENTGEIYGAKVGTSIVTVTVTDADGNTISDSCEVTVKYLWWQWLIRIFLFGCIWY